MSLSKRQREQLLRRHCGNINEDDAIDPRTYFKAGRQTKMDRKAMQLAKQIAETLQLVLTDDHSELDGLSVLNVIPAPDSRRMLVTVAWDCSVQNDDQPTQHDQLMSELQQHVPRLRAEIARSITRKKTPQLTFEIVPVRSGLPKDCLLYTSDAADE